jgi:hypothetical protein
MFTMVDSGLWHSLRNLTSHGPACPLDDEEGMTADAVHRRTDLDRAADSNLGN